MRSLSMSRLKWLQSLAQGQKQNVMGGGPWCGRQTVAQRGEAANNASRRGTHEGCPYETYKLFAKKTRIYDIAMRTADFAVRGSSLTIPAHPKVREPPARREFTECAHRGEGDSGFPRKAERVWCPRRRVWRRFLACQNKKSNRRRRWKNSRATRNGRPGS